MNLEHTLHRQIYWLSDSHGILVDDVAFLQYTLPKGITSVNFIPRRHGHAGKKGTLFLDKLSRSVRNKLKTLLLDRKPATLRESENQDPLCEKPCDQPLPDSIYKT